MKKITVVAGVIKKGNLYLCTERDISKYPYSSYKWEFPGGKMEVNESKEDTLKRELREELEIEVEIENFFCGINYIYPDFELVMYIYECKMLSEEVRLNVHKDYKWLPLEELKSLDWTRADSIVVDKLLTEKTKRTMN